MSQKRMLAVCLDASVCSKPKEATFAQRRTLISER
jgi:hypothetical protein